MKNIYLFSLAIATVFAFGSCSKDDAKDLPTDGTGNNVVKPKPIEVKEQQRSLFVDFTATWCPPCGKYGLPGFKAALSNPKNEDLLVGLAVHPSNSELVAYFKKKDNDSAFVSPVLNDFSKNVISITGYPTLFINSKKLPLNSQVAQNAQTEIDLMAAKAPVAGVGLEVTPTANGIKVRSAVKFFKEATGDYYVSILMSEDNIPRRQMIGDVGGPSNYYDNNYVHAHILRGAAINSSNSVPSTFGDAAVASGTIEAGKYVENEYTYTFSAFSNIPATINEWVWKPENTNVIAILWKKDGASMTFVNVTQVKVK